VALSDAGRSLATPREVVSTAALDEHLRAMLEKEGVAEVVVGVPKTLRGEVGFQAAKVLYTLRNLKEKYPGVRFVEWDERLTTRAALDGAARGGGRRGRGKKAASRARVDHIAAAVMLQEYLDRRRDDEAVRQG
jgi:putative Holliday junction resolvase